MRDRLVVNTVRRGIWAGLAIRIGGRILRYDADPHASRWRASLMRQRQVDGCTVSFVPAGRHLG
jgi:hypothetical protein